MKKFFVVLLLLFVGSISGFIQVKAEVSEFTSNNTYLGKTINTVKANNYNELSPSNVLDSDYYASLVYGRNTNDCAAYSDYETGSSSMMVKNEFNDKYTYKTEIAGIKYSGFTLGASQRCSLSLSKEESYYASRVYMSFVGKRDYETYYIADIYAKLDDFREHLSSNYLKELNMLAHNEIDYENFFDTCGTHIIANYTTGDRFYLDYCVVTNEKKISTSCAINFVESLKLGVANTGVDIDKSYTSLSKYGLSEDSSELHYTTMCDSGISFNTSSVEDNINLWKDYMNNESYLNKNAVIVRYNINGLIPIWKFLPSQSPISEEQMITYYKAYCAKNNVEYDALSDYKFEPNISDSLLLRSSTKTIKDCDRFSNPIDYFKIDTKYGISMIKSEYKYITFTISFDAYKKNKGDRYLYLYNASDAYEGSKAHLEYLCEFTEINDLSTSIYTSTNIVTTFTLSISNLKGLDLALVWRASGNGKDKWYNLNLNVSYKIWKP